MGTLSQRQSGRLPSLSAGTQELAFALRSALKGKLNNTDEITLNASTTTTTKNDEKVGKNSVILLMPTTASAATEYGAGSWYITVTKGSFTITHANTADADKTFAYIVFG